jgi:hypothetical protein
MASRARERAEKERKAARIFLAAPRFSDTTLDDTRRTEK